MTAAERLKQLSGLSSATAAAMLLAIATGASAGALLVNHSGLSTGTAAQHLLADKQQQEQENSGGGSAIDGYRPIKQPAQPVVTGEGATGSQPTQFAPLHATRTNQALAHVDTEQVVTEKVAEVVSFELAKAEVGDLQILEPIAKSEPLAPVNRRQPPLTAANLDNQPEKTYGTQTIQTIQAEAQRQQEKALLIQRDEELALILILMEFA